MVTHDDQTTILNDRLGILVVSPEHLSSFAPMFAVFIPIRAREAFDRNGIEYVCRSDAFDVVPYGGRIPVYVPACTRDGECLRVSLGKFSWLLTPPQVVNDGR